MTDTSDIWNEELFAAIERGHMTIVQRMLAKALGESLESKFRGHYTRSPLHLAVLLGRVDIAEALLVHGADVNERGHGRSPLHDALGKGETMVRLLLLHGADPNLRTEPFLLSDSSYMTPLDQCFISFQNRHDVDAVVHALLEFRADPNLIKSGSWSNLQRAVRYEMSVVVRDLIEHGADVNLANYHGGTALMRACYRGSVELAGLLLSKGADPNAVNADGDCALSIALVNGDDAMERLLLSAGANPLPAAVAQELRAIAALGAAEILAENIDVTERDDKGQTLLHLAVADGNTDLIRRLLELGADVDARDKRGQTPLSHAIQAGSPPAVKMLLAAGADSLAMDHYRISSLDHSLERQWPDDADSASELADQLAIVRMILDTGLLTRYPRNLKWEQMLSRAINHGCAGFLRLLFEYGLDPNIPRRGEPLILEAIYRNRYDVFFTFMEAGADIRWDSASMYGTAFQDAALRGAVEIVRYFLEHEADPNSGHEGMPALIAAACSGSIEMVQMLIESGADVSTIMTSVDKWRDQRWLNSIGDIPMIRFLLDTGAPAGYILYEASRHGDTELIEWLLGYGIDINLTTHLSETALMAALSGYENVNDCVTLLLERGADVNLVSKAGEIALKFAAQQPDIVHRLLAAGADPNVGHGETVLMAAVQGGAEESVMLLLDAGADINAVTVDGDSALRVAYGTKQDNIAQILLGRGACEPETARTNLRAAILWHRTEDALRLISEGADIDVSDIHGDSPLRMAIEQMSDLSVVEALLKNGADINQPPSEKLRDNPYEVRREGTPLIKSVAKGRAELIRLLLAYGADPNLACHGYRALPDAVLNLTDPTHETRPERLEIVRALLEAGASPNIHDGGEGLTPLQESTRRGDIETMGLLIEYGADVEMPSDTDNTAGNTALSYAICHLRETAAHYLIEHGANVNALSEIHDSPLGYACDRGPGLAGQFANEQYSSNPDTQEDDSDEIKLRLAALLLRHGADVNNKTTYGRTPLLEACDTQQYTDARCKLIRLLLDASAEVNIEDEWGSTPLAYAKETGAQTVVDWLMEHGARA